MAASGMPQVPEARMTDATPTLEATARACYETFLDGTGDFTSRDWDRLTVAERETWRRVVLRAWGKL